MKHVKLLLGFVNPVLFVKTRVSGFENAEHLRSAFSHIVL